jgi:hypothetical protein
MNDPLFDLPSFASAASAPEAAPPGHRPASPKSKDTVRVLRRQTPVDVDLDAETVALLTRSYSTRSFKCCRCWSSNSWN